MIFEFFKLLFKSDATFRKELADETRNFIANSDNDVLIESLRHVMWQPSANMIIVEIFRRHEKEISELRKK